MTTILVSAGDLSGERHAAALVEAIRERRPDVRFLGMGGGAMAEAGVELLVDQRELAVGGIFEALTSLSRVIRAWREMVRGLRAHRPELVILVDSGGFNLPFARHVRRKSRAKILYYVAPQVWAWREGRVAKLARRCDRIAVILPFEKRFYAERGVNVDYVGHPLLDAVERDRTGSGAERRLAARKRLGIDAARRVLSLFPGSRRTELDQYLDLLIDVVRIVRSHHPGLQVVVARAASLDGADFDARLAAAPDLVGSLQVVSGDSPDAIDAADVALSKPGTITLELMLRQRPMVVVGRAHRLTAWIVRRWVRVAFTSMPNLLAGKAIVPEFIQEQAHADDIARAVLALFETREGAVQLHALESLREELGAPGASRRGAQIVEDLLGSAAA